MSEFKNPLTINVTVRGIGATGAPGVPGIPGPKGDPGEKGESLKYEDLTPEQKEELRADPYDDTEVKKSIGKLASDVEELKKKPAGFSGNYNDLTNKPDLFSGKYADLDGKPDLFSGNYNDLQNKPTIPEAYNDSEIKKSVNGIKEDLTNLEAKVDNLPQGGGSVSGKGWTSHQIDLFDRLLDFLEFTDDSTGQRIANELIESLRSGASEDEGGDTPITPPTPTKKDYEFVNGVTIDAITTTYGELNIPVSLLEGDTSYFYMLAEDTPISSYTRINTSGFFFINSDKTKVIGYTNEYNFNGFNRNFAVVSQNLVVTGSNMTKFYAGTTYNIYKLTGGGTND